MKLASMFSLVSVVSPSCSYFPSSPFFPVLVLSRPSSPSTWFLRSHTLPSLLSDSSPQSDLLLLVSVTLSSLFSSLFFTFYLGFLPAGTLLLFYLLPFPFPLPSFLISCLLLPPSFSLSFSSHLPPCPHLSSSFLHLFSCFIYLFTIFSSSPLPLTLSSPFALLARLPSKCSAHFKAFLDIGKQKMQLNACFHPLLLREY